MLSATVEERRLAAIAGLEFQCCLMHDDPGEVSPILEAFERVLDIASFAPGGWGALIDGLRSCKGAEDVKAFCRAFTMVITVEGQGDGPACAHDGAVEL